MKSKRPIIEMMTLVSVLVISTLLIPSSSATVLAAPPSVKHEQCQPGDTGYPDCNCIDNPNPDGWKTGLNQGPFSYGDILPYRALFSNMVTGQNYTLEIEYDTTKAGQHAIDYLCTFNETLANADPCSDHAPAACGDIDTYPIPTDPQVEDGYDEINGTSDDIIQLPGVFTLYGGTITSVSGYTGDDPFVSDSKRQIAVNFTADVDGNMVLAWGGHIAHSDDWAGHAYPTGSPYHMRFVNFTCTTGDCSTGQQDLALTEAAIQEPEPSIVVTKTADPTSVTEPGGTVTFVVVIVNTSDTTDPVTITSLNDTIYGDLNGQGNCTLPQTIAPGDSYTCSFNATVNGNAGDSETNTTTASGTDDEGTPVSDYDDATVTVTDATPTITVDKTADPTSVTEPGGTVTFVVVIVNTSDTTDPVTITSLTDDIYGDLNGQGNCTLPQTIAPGDSYTCSFNATVSGNAGDSETNTTTAWGTDDEGTPVSDYDDATVTITDATPTITVDKTANPTSVTEPGRTVTFVVVIVNTSNTTDPVTITSLNDTTYGDLDGQGNCTLPQTIAPGDSYTCSFDATVNGNAGDSETNTTTASGTDDEGTPVSNYDDATVNIKPPLPDGGVGGEAYPVNKLGILAPWIAFGAAIITGASLLVIRRRGSTDHSNSI